MKKLSAFEPQIEKHYAYKKHLCNLVLFSQIVIFSFTQQKDLKLGHSLDINDMTLLSQFSKVT